MVQYVGLSKVRPQLVHHSPNQYTDQFFSLQEVLAVLWMVPCGEAKSGGSRMMCGNVCGGKLVIVATSSVFSHTYQ